MRVSKGILTLLAGGVVGYVLLLGACVAGNEGPTATSSAPLVAPFALENEVPGAPPTQVEWTVASTTKGSLSASSQLTAVVSNYTNVPQPIHVYLTASGLDQRLAQADLGIFTVPAAVPGVAGVARLTAGTTNITTSFAQFPVQSVGAQSEVELQAVFHENLPDQLVANSSPFYYAFQSTSYANVTSYGYDGIDFPNLSQGLTGIPLMQNVSNSASDIYSAVGRFRTASGWQAVNIAGPPANTDSVLQTHLINGQRNQAMDQYDWFDNLPVEQTVPAGNVNNSYQICTTWRAEFIDDNHNGSIIIPINNVTDVAARFSRYLIEGPGHEYVAKGNLDANGCTMPVLLNPGAAYALWQTTQLQVPSSTVPKVTIQYGGWDPNYYYYVPQVWGQTATWSALELTAFAVAPTSTTAAKKITTTGVDVCINSAAETGRILNTPNLSLAGITSLPLVILANILDGSGKTGFTNPPQDSFGVNLTSPTNMYGVWLGPSKFVPHNTKYQTIIAHEMGHQTQMFKMGTSFFGFGYGSTNQSCMCNQVVEPDASHCLQSLVGNGFAINEGYAQFFAARVTNPTQSLGSCTLEYYKEFLEDDGGIDLPPVAKPCIGAITWETNHCPAALNTVEWDWMNFLWRINGDPASPIGPDDIKSLYQYACGGNCLTTGTTLSFSQLNTAAQQVLTPSKRALYSTQGANYRVNY